MTAEAQAGPQQAEPVKDFLSIQLVLDHLQLKASGKFVQKFILSEETPDEALMALAEYYGLQGAIASVSGIAIIRASAEYDDFAYLMVTPENVQVLTTLETWAALVTEFNGNMAATVDFLSKAAANQIDAFIKQHGAPPALSLMSIYVADPEVEGAPE